MSDDRKLVLLRAAYDLLTRAERGRFIQQATSILTHYDSTNCDGYCLREDIATELGIESDADPIPLKAEAMI